MKLKRFSIGTLGLLAVSGLAWSCAGKSEDCNANLNCAPYGGEVGTSGASGASGNSGRGGAGGSSSGASGTSGTSGEGGNDVAAGSGGAPPTPCDGTLGPDMDACVISDEFGLFVAPSTNDDPLADGTQAHPYATVTQALAKIMKIKHVYVCAGEYAEPATLTIPDRVSIYGRFTCDGGTWKYDADTPAYLHSAAPIGAMITDAKVGVMIQDLRLDAANADDGVGASSFGLVISGSQNVALKRVEIHAGKGGKGKTGTDGVNGADGIASGSDQNGKAGTCTSAPGSQMGPAQVPKVCDSEGGAGGMAYAAVSYSPMQDGSSAYLVSPSNGGKGGEILGQNAKPGQPGENGARGEPGAIAPAIGAFAKDGYQVASGGSGTAGKAGFGGGGGGASLGAAGTTTCLGSTGGAGGMGGCGGDLGSGGLGGGASVALLSWRSSLSIDSCKLTALSGGAGGDGGKGHVGGTGKAGGTGGPADPTGTVGKGGNGGDGGNGGNGGSGAGGTGGPSIALVYDGTAPTRVGESTLSFAAAAAGGKGGTLGSVSAPDGLKGLAQDVYTKP